MEMERRRLGAASGYPREGIGEATTYLLPEFPAEHRRRIRTNNMMNGPTGRAGTARASSVASRTATAC